MKKKSAVDWLATEIDDYLTRIPSYMIINAKKMEESNLVSSYFKGFIFGLFSALLGILLSKLL
jgi:hypothetical protein